MKGAQRDVIIKRAPFKPQTVDGNITLVSSSCFFYRWMEKILTIMQNNWSQLKWLRSGNYVIIVPGLPTTVFLNHYKDQCCAMKPSLHCFISESNKWIQSDLLTQPLFKTRIHFIVWSVHSWCTTGSRISKKHNSASTLLHSAISGGRTSQLRLLMLILSTQACATLWSRIQRAEEGLHCHLTPLSMASYYKDR